MSYAIWQGVGCNDSTFLTSYPLNSKPENDLSREWGKADLQLRFIARKTDENINKH